MKTMIVDRTTEKIALANELGLNRWVDSRKQEAVERELLTSLTFKPITDEAIEKMLCKRVFNFGVALNEYVVVFTVILGGVVLLTTISCMIDHTSLSVLGPITLGVLALNVINWLAISFPKTEVREGSLHDWHDNLPYGALLAVKEAKEQRFGNFRIHYPVLNRQRVMSDPVITASINGSDKGFMIFAWDDGKVYE